MILIRNSISILSMPVCFLSYSRSFTCWIWMDMDGYGQICSPEIKWQLYSYSDVLPGVLAVRQSQTPLPARVSRSGGGAKSSVGDVFYFESPQFWDQNKTGHAFPIWCHPLPIQSGGKSSTFSVQCQRFYGLWWSPLNPRRLRQKRGVFWKQPIRHHPKKMDV